MEATSNRDDYDQPDTILVLGWHIVTMKAPKSRRQKLHPADL